VPAAQLVTEAATVFQLHRPNTQRLGTAQLLTVWYKYINSKLSHLHSFKQCACLLTKLSFRYLIFFKISGMAAALMDKLPLDPGFPQWGF
jgi:hypothetical protein